MLGLALLGLTLLGLTLLGLPHLRLTLLGLPLLGLPLLSLPLILWRNRLLQRFHRLAGRFGRRLVLAPGKLFARLLRRGHGFGQQIRHFTALLPRFRELLRRRLGDLLLLFRQRLPQAIHRGLLSLLLGLLLCLGFRLTLLGGGRHLARLLFQRLLRLAQFPRLLGQGLRFLCLLLEHFRPGLRLLAKLLPELLLHRLLLLLPLLRQLGLLLLRRRLLLGLPREFLLLLRQLLEARQLLDLLPVAIHRVPHFLEILHRLLRLVSGGVHLLLPLLLAVLQGRALQLLAGHLDLLRCLSYFVRLRSVDAFLHPLGELFQLLLGIGQLLPRLLEILLRLLAELLVLHLPAALVHLLPGLLGRLDRFLDLLARLFVFRTHFLPRQRLRIAVDPDQKPLRMPHARSIELRRPRVRRPDPQADLVRAGPFLHQRADRQLALAAVARGLRRAAQLDRQVLSHPRRLLAGGLHLERDLRHPEILRHLVAQIQHLVRPHPQLAGDRAQPAHLRQLVLQHPHRKAQRFHLAAQQVLQGHHRLAPAIRGQRPRKVHPPTRRRALDPTLRQALALDLQPRGFDRRVQISRQLDLRPPHRFDAGSERLFLRQNARILRKDPLHSRLHDPRQRPHRHRESIALPTTASRPIREALAHRIHPVGPEIAIAVHRLRHLGAARHRHHQIQRIRRAVVGDLDQQRVPV